MTNLDRLGEPAWDEMSTDDVEVCDVNDQTSSDSRSPAGPEVSLSARVPSGASLREALAEALHLDAFPDDASPVGLSCEHSAQARRVAQHPALQQIEHDAAWGAAWRKCQEALPEPDRGLLTIWRHPDGTWHAVYDLDGSWVVTGPTPAAALNALRDALNERKVAG